MEESKYLMKNFEAERSCSIQKAFFCLFHKQEQFNYQRVTEKRVLYSVATLGVDNKTTGNEYTMISINTKEKHFNAKYRRLPTPLDRDYILHLPGTDFD